MNDLQKAEDLIGLMGRDPERWKPMTYGLQVDVPVLADGRGETSVTTMNQPFILASVATHIIGNTSDYDSTGLVDDGQYLIKWRDQMREYNNIPIHADLLFGPKTEGSYRTLEYPVYYAGNHTISFELYNVYNRVLTPVADFYRVQIVLRGLADWGKLKTTF